MLEAPVTRASLLVRLRDARDERAWTQFVDLYAPLVYGYAQRHGLQDADAADLTQTVLHAVAGAIGRFRYDPSRGSFRGWLFTIVRNKVLTFLSKRHDFCQGTGHPATEHLLEAQPAPEQETAAWDSEYEQRLFAWAVDQVRPRVHETTWQAFWQTAVERKSAKEVAETLDLRVGAVHLAKSRVLARLKAAVQQARDSEFPDPEDSRDADEVGHEKSSLP
jgi:RNA polymerase sigma factor (sigma-70 family)